MRNLITKAISLLVMVLVSSSIQAQVYDHMPQINYEDLPASVQSSLLDEIEKMNLDDFRFNFHKFDNSSGYIVVFLRHGVDLKALGGLETIIFTEEGTITEWRYKYYSEELLVSIPLDLIMNMQEKTKNVPLNYLTKIRTASGEITYHAVSEDSAYVFNNKMEYISTASSDQYMDELISE